MKLPGVVNMETEKRNTIMQFRLMRGSGFEIEKKKLVAFPIWR